MNILRGKGRVDRSPTKLFYYFHRERQVFSKYGKFKNNTLCNEGVEMLALT